MKPGIAFPDSISTGKRSKRSFEQDPFKETGTRGMLLPICLLVFLGILFVRLLDLQLFKGSYYRLLSDANRTRTTFIYSPRGIIFDRNGVPLTFNIPGFRKKEGDEVKLLTREEALPLIAQDENLEVDNLRHYPYKEVFSHALGYVGQVSKEELGQAEWEEYKVGDLIGKMGIERMYEKKLAGRHGRKLEEVDVLGKVVRTLGQEDPIPGEDIRLTLDAKLQQAAFEALSKVKKGAVIVSTPKGEILTLLSKPWFDQNLFTMGERYTPDPASSYQTVSELLLDQENQPLLNRAISGRYPPGSTFKLVTSAAGLEEKVIDEHFQVEDTGILRVGSFSFGNWYFLQYGKKDGLVDVVKALKRSNDIFFYKVAQMIGVEKLSAMAQKFGAGKQLGIDLEGEVSGLVPTPAWKKQTTGEPWFLGDTYHYGIGQGYLLATPLQVNAWAQVIANGGTLYQPHLLKSSKFKVQSSKFLSDKTLKLIRQGMIESCEPEGVAWPLFELKVPAKGWSASGGKNEKLKIDGKNFLEVPQATNSAAFKDYRQVVVACKTGTAQHGGEKDLPHAWITLFAPAYNPEIVVTVLVESSGEGSNIAAPIAKKILEEWFGR